jgi:protein-tyrosine phosphatase
MQDSTFISADDLADLLFAQFFKVLIIDFCKVPNGLIPASRYFPGLFQLVDKLGTGSQPEIIKDKIYETRKGSCVVIYGETGQESRCFELSQYLKNEGLTESCRILEGGINQFELQYPFLCRNSPYPLRSEIEMSILGSLGSIEADNPIEHLDTLQTVLINQIWFANDKNQVRDMPTEIISDTLYLSSCYGCHPTVLVSLGITRVVRLGWGFPHYIDDQKSLEILQYRIADSPHEDIHEILLNAIDKIEQYRVEGHRVLVHCHAGISRSPSVVLAYLMKWNQLTLYDAWNMVFLKRPIIRPNSGFSKTLLNLETEFLNLETNSMKAFWMESNYIFYKEYIEYMYRYASGGSYLSEQ